jgi:phospholipid transport system substrate-binding protein
MLENVYLTKIENYSGEKVVYETAREIGKGKYAVNTKIVKDNLEIPVTYRLKRIKDKWVGYDVIVEGVSLVKNYRSQFQQILKKKSPEELLAHMRQKVKAMEKAQDNQKTGKG